MDPIIGSPDVELTLGAESDVELVLGFRRDDDITALATADSGRLRLYRGELDHE